jgi:hypothetical protein
LAVRYSASQPEKRHEDLDAIVAYLRGLKPVRNEAPDPVYKVAVRRDPYPDAEAGFSKTMLADPVRRAPISSPSAIAWSATPHGRAACRISRPASAAAAGLFRRAKWCRGSPASIAANITSDPAAGIGAWTDAEIKRAITHGIARDGRALKQPMAYGSYAGLNEADLADIVVYLRTVPPLQ